MYAFIHSYFCTLNTTINDLDAFYTTTIVCLYLLITTARHIPKIPRTEQFYKIEWTKKAILAVYIYVRKITCMDEL